MKNNAFIKIKGIQTADGDNDVVELMTTGFFARRRGGYVISYEESEATGFEGARTTLTCEEGKVTAPAAMSAPSSSSRRGSATSAATTWASAA